MKQVWVVLKCFSCFAAMVGLYVACMPGGIGVRLAAVVAASAFGAGCWWSKQQAEMPVVVRIEALKYQVEGSSTAETPEALELPWIQMPVRRPAPVFVHSMDAWSRR